MQKDEFRRGLILPLLVSILGFAAFVRSGGAEHVRTVDMLALIAIGMGLGRCRGGGCCRGAVVHDPRLESHQADRRPPALLGGGLGLLAGPAAESVWHLCVAPLS